MVIWLDEHHRLRVQKWGESGILAIPPTAIPAGKMIQQFQQPDEAPGHTHWPPRCWICSCHADMLRPKLTFSWGNTSDRVINQRITKEDEGLDDSCGKRSEKNWKDEVKPSNHWSEPLNTHCGNDCISTVYLHIVKKETGTDPLWFKIGLKCSQFR